MNRLLQGLKIHTQKVSENGEKGSTIWWVLCSLFFICLEKPKLYMNWVAKCVYTGSFLQEYLHKDSLAHNVRFLGQILHRFVGSGASNVGDPFLL